MFIDSHCHLNLLDLSPEAEFSSLDQVLAECKTDLIEHLLCVAVDLENFQELLKIAKKYNNISISAGIHPNDSDSKNSKDCIIDCNHNNNQIIDDYDLLLSQASHTEVIAIGETGLDYYRTEEKQDWQHERFIAHINIAKQLKKPLIIHTRNAPDDTINFLINHKANEIGGVMHCFTENWKIAKQALDLGFYISLSGIVTFKNAAQVHEVAQKVPLDRLLIETDSPYLAPVPYRGKTNYPQYVKHVAAKIAELRGVNILEIAAATTSNFYNLFNISY
jgi:TatD DNase family protein